MNNYSLESLLKNSSELEFLNSKLEKYSAKKRISWALKNLPQNFILSSSFGIQSSVLLHLITKKIPDIPVVLIDTGYLFPETYKFIDTLTKFFQLNLKVFRANQSSAWQEARYGKLWKKGLKGIKLYNYINKVQPMKKAIKILKCKTWFSGLRRVQSSSRSNLPVLKIQDNVFKFFPIVDWDNRKTYFYIKKNKLSYHPLWKKGYVSVGDIHTTSVFTKNMLKEEETRFYGLYRECGLHKL